MQRILLLLVGLAACDTDEPAHPERYRLNAVDGRPIPAVLDSGKLDHSDTFCWNRISSGLYVLMSDTTWRDELQRAWGCGQVAESILKQSAGSYFTLRDTLRFRTSANGFVMWRATRRHDTLLVDRPDIGAEYIGSMRRYAYVRER